MSSIINNFAIGTSNIQVGVVLFSSTATNSFFLNTNSNLNSVLSTISNLPYTTQSSSTENIAAALNVARTQQFTISNGDRIGAPNVAIVILNGVTPAILTQAQTELNAMSLAGITVYSVGMSSRITGASVRALSTIPQRIYNNYFLSANFSVLGTVANPLAQQICQTVNADCQRRVFDLVFVLTSSTLVQQDSSSGWSNLVNFVATLVSGMNIGPQATRIGVVIFADQVQQILSLTQFSDVNQITQFIRSQGFNLNLGSGQNIQAALNFVQTQLFGTSQDRADVPNVIVLITNTASTANTLQTITTAQSIQQLGTQILAIGSTSRVNVTELQLISSAPRLQNHGWWTINDFSTASFANIQSDFSKELCRPIYEYYCQPTEFGGYQCFCPWGLCDTRPLNGTQCIDVNECLVNNGGCQQLCSNRVGSFSCSCQSGFSLASDGKFCNDVDECKTPGTCAVGNCVNSYGAYYCVQDASFISVGFASQDSADGLGPTIRKIVYTPDSLIMAVVVAVSITMLSIVVIALGVRHAVKLRANRDCDADIDELPSNVGTSTDDSPISTLSSLKFDSKIRSQPEYGNELDSAPLNVNIES